MVCKNILRAFFALSVILTLSAGSGLAELRPVSVKGGQVRGIEENGLVVYRGIPFAAPPVGELRWKAPQKAAPWNGILEAEHFRASCPQMRLPDFASLDNDVGQQSEDCLYLNIWTPIYPGEPKKLPVMVWIHGGGFATGAPFQKNFTGENIAKQGIVMVSIAYRLNIFGFLAHPELSAESGTSGNYGLMDQIAALQWIQDNIAAFGGDSDNVTIFGQSAGGLSVSMLCASPMARGLFKRAISQSGGAFGPIETTRIWGIQDLKAAEQFGKGIVERIGASSIEALRQIPAEELEPLGRPNSPLGLFWPVCDGKLITGDPYRLYQQGNYNDVDILIGINSNEGGAFFTSPIAEDDYLAYMDIFKPMKREALTLYPCRDEAEILKSQQAIFQDTILGWPTYTWARLQSKTGKSKVYVYCFTQTEPSHESALKLEGAAHGDEINYVFGHTKDNYDFHYTDDDQALSNQMMSYWVNFARTGDPNGDRLPYWPQYREGQDTTMYLNSSGSQAGPQPHEERMKFLTRYFEKIRK